MPLKDFKCDAGHIHDALVKPDIQEHECPECGETASMVFLTPSRIDWYNMAMGENAGPEFIARFDKNHRKQKEKEEKYEKEHGLPDLNPSDYS